MQEMFSNVAHRIRERWLTFNIEFKELYGTYVYGTHKELIVYGTKAIEQ
jgi:hypothetical protein